MKCQLLDVHHPCSEDILPAHSKESGTGCPTDPIRLSTKGLLQQWWWFGSPDLSTTGNRFFKVSLGPVDFSPETDLTSWYKRIFMNCRFFVTSWKTKTFRKKSTGPSTPFHLILRFHLARREPPKRARALQRLARETAIPCALCLALARLRGLWDRKIRWNGVLVQMLPTTGNIERAGTSEKIQPQINANERKSIRNGR